MCVLNEKMSNKCLINIYYFVDFQIIYIDIIYMQIDTSSTPPPIQPVGYMPSLLERHLARQRGEPNVNIIPSSFPWKIIIIGHGYEYIEKKTVSFPFKCLKQYCRTNQSVHDTWRSFPSYPRDLSIDSGVDSVIEIAMDHPEFIIEKTPLTPGKMTIHDGGLNFDITDSNNVEIKFFKEQFGIWLIKPGSVPMRIQDVLQLGREKFYSYSEMIIKVLSILVAKSCPDLAAVELCISACRSIDDTKTRIGNVINMGDQNPSGQKFVKVVRGGSKDQDAIALRDKITNSQLNQLSSDSQFLQVTADQYHYYVTNPESTIEDVINSLPVEEVMELMETNPQLRGGKHNKTKRNKRNKRTRKTK
jgi:hypothetical protein